MSITDIISPINLLKGTHEDTGAYADTCAYTCAKKLRASLFDAGIRFLDRALPPAQPVSDVVIARATKLMEIAA